MDAESIHSSIVWEQIEPGEMITTDDIELDEAPDEVLVTVEPSGTTFANDKAIWRDENGIHRSGHGAGRIWSEREDDERRSVRD